MTVVHCGVCPHPPIVVPEVGGDEASLVSDTQDALLELGRRLKKSGADTVVIISPHAPIFRDVIGINMSPLLTGDLGSFRAGNVRYMMENDLDLAGEINKQAAGLGLTVVELTETEERQYGITLRLDHGVVVPLYFLRQEMPETLLVHVSMALGEPQRLYLFGVAVRRA
jgi:aromatic ring-opening dioxygenase LigB subunit